MSEKLKKSIEVKLLTPLEYAEGGEKVFAKSLTLYPPKGKHRKKTQGIKHAFFKAIDYHRKDGNQSEETSGGAKKDAEISGEEVYSMILMSDADIDKFESDFRNLLIADGICKVDDKEPLTDVLLEELSDADYDAVVGAYLGNFIVSYLMKSLNKS